MCDFVSAVASVERLQQLRTSLNELLESGTASDHPVFREYVGELAFEAPEGFPEARSVVVLAVPTPLQRVRVHLDGQAHDVMLPPQYYLSGVTRAGLAERLLPGIREAGGERAVYAPQVQLKALAVRSGLGAYGRNGICYVDGMGSFLTLHAFFTDAEARGEVWQEPRLMDSCNACSRCVEACPCGCIPGERPVIDAGRCVTLYNEVGGEFPESIPRDAHNALMGCMRCQLCCPANRDAISRAERLEDITEAETRRVLDGDVDQALMESLAEKLRGFPPTASEGLFPLFTRNLRALLDARRHGRASIQ